MRRVLFQIHLWTGLATGIYILAICLSGSAIVFRRELDRALCRRDGFVCEPPFVTWLADFHGELLAGTAGLRWNGIGAMTVTSMCVTGAILWWPRQGGWWRRVSIRRQTDGRRFVRDLHNMLGFWLFLLILLWAFTGIYFAFPDIVNAPAAWLEDKGCMTAALFMQDAINLLAHLHFGRAYGLLVKTLWVVLGLAPCALVITGFVMWRKGKVQHPNPLQAK